MTLEQAFDSLVNDIKSGKVTDLPTKTGRTTQLSISPRGTIKWNKGSGTLSPHNISYSIIAKVYPKCSSIADLRSLNNVNSFFRNTLRIKTNSTYLYAVMLEVLKRMGTPSESKEYSDLTILNLTHRLSYRPSNSALRLFWGTLTATQLAPFNCRSIEMWKEWILPGAKSETPKWDFEQSLALNIPIFLVDRELSGTSIYVPVLGRRIPVPKDIWPNIPAREEVGKDTLQRENMPKICERDEEGQCRVENCQWREQVICPREGMDVWGCFTVIQDSSAKDCTPYKLSGMPAIFLWMDKIIEATTDERDFEMLFVKVLLHELAHALMYTGEFGSGKFHKWNEECLANAYALSKIRRTGDPSFYDFARKIVLKQPANYALGAKYADACDFDPIRGFMDAWTHQKVSRSLDPKTKEDWLVYVQRNTLEEQKLKDYYLLMKA